MSEESFENDVEILGFLEELREREIQIWAEGEKLRYRARNNQLNMETLDTLKRTKKQILNYLAMIARNTVPLTPIQAAYVVGQKKGCELGNINAHYYIEYKVQELDIKRLEQVVNLVIEKNDALRMIVTHEGNASFLDKVPYYSIQVYDAGLEQDKMRMRLERSRCGYDYHKWPMFHFCVGKTGEKEGILHVDFDCIILDAWSAKLMLDEIFQLYCGKNIKFPELSFKEYMRLKTYEANQKAEEYWKKQVQNMPKYPKLNFQREFKEVQDIKFDRVEYGFSQKETQRLYEKIKTYHFTPAAVISTIFMKTLAQYSEVPAVAVNVTLFNRQPLHEEVNQILGEFTNTAVISYRKGKDSILDTIRLTQNQMWKLVQYRGFDGTDILKLLSEGEPGKVVMPIVFTCMLAGNNSLIEERKSHFREEFAISQTPQVVLDHHVRDDLGYLKVSWDYIIEIFDRQDIMEIFNTYIKGIKDFINNDIF